MHRFERLFFIMLIAMVSIIIPAKVYGEEEMDKYVVYDASTEEIIGEYQYEYEAYYAYQNNVRDFDNLVLERNGKVVEMEYGYVILRDKLEYRSTIYNINRTVDGDKGTEAVYLRTRLGMAFFYLSGEIGYIDHELVEMVPYDELTDSASYYEVLDGKLYHLINTTIDNPYHNHQLLLGKAPEGLDSGKYYSYDGHYFYDDFLLMCDDYRTNRRTGAINGEPYYNYYQYLPFHSSSNYTGKDIDDYLENVLCFDRRMTSYLDSSKDGANDVINASELYKSGAYFDLAERNYGTNKAMLVSMAIVDSSYGKSLEAYKNHSLYRGMAFDSEEKRDGGYETTAESIDVFSRYYISTAFDNYLKPGFAGTNFGTQISGFATSYNNDPYYGEKLAAQYYAFDEKMGLKDYESQQIAIVNSNNLILYANPECTDYHYSLGNIHDFGLIVLEELDDVYRVKLTQSLKLDINYPEAYIRKNTVDYVIGSIQTSDPAYTVVFEYDGGLVEGSGKLQSEVEEGKYPSSPAPLKDGYEFIGFDKEIAPASENITYTAMYREVSKVSLKNGSELVIRNGSPDISSINLIVEYADGGVKITDVNMDEVHIAEDRGTVIYAGFEVPLSLRHVEDDDLNLAAFMDDPSSFEVGDVEAIIESSNSFGMDEIRMLDDYLIKARNDNYHFFENDFDLSISGLASSLRSIDDHKLFKNCIYVKAKPFDPAKDKRVDKLLAGYGFEYVEGLKVELKTNYQKSEVIAPLVYQIKAEPDQYSYYAVYHLDGKDVEKCYTQWSNGYVRFMSDKTGNFIVLKKKSFDRFDFEDKLENIGNHNNGFDNHKFIRNVLTFALLYLMLLLNAGVYFWIQGKEEKEWRDCRRLLLPVATVQEEKPKN